MIPAPFDYHRPGTLDEADRRCLRATATDAKVLSGGMSLLPALKLRLGSFGHLVDIGRIPGLEYIREDRRRAAHRRRHAPVRARALGAHRDRSIRSSRRRRAADRRPAGAQPRHDGRQPRQRRPGKRRAGDRHRARRHVVARGPKGERTIAANQFYKGLFTTALARGRDPHRDPHPASAGAERRRLPQAQAQDRRLRHRRGRRCSSRSTRSGAVERAGIALTNAGADAVEALEAAKYLDGKTPGREGDRRGGPARRSQASAPSADRRGSVEYKREMVAGAGRARAARGARARREEADHGQASHQRHRERRGARGRGRVAPAARALHSREPAPHRHPHRLRHLALRRLHRAARRRAGEVLHRARRAGRRLRDPRPSRAGAGRQAPSGPGGASPRSTGCSAASARRAC